MVVDHEDACEIQGLCHLPHLSIGRSGPGFERPKVYSWVPGRAGPFGGRLDAGETGGPRHALDSLRALSGLRRTRPRNPRTPPVNRLQHETSPYLLQHASNPVDWFPWGEEALERARTQDKPILLSIGYAACHWCHVMERESFEDPETAALMNERFVSIKVDREERPDLDAIYMDAVQAMTGQRRLAADRVPDDRRPALLRRHLLPGRGPPRPPVVPKGADGDRGRLGAPSRRSRDPEREGDRGDRADGAARGVDGAAHRRGPARRVRGAARGVRPALGRVREGARSSRSR